MDSLNVVQSLLPLYEPRADFIVIARYIVIVLSFLFVPYISVLFGSVVFSLAASTKGHFEEKPLLSRFSEEVMGMLGNNLVAGLVLAILPLVTMLIAFSQLMYGSVIYANIGQYLLITTILIAAGIISAYVFNKSFATRDKSIGMHAFLGLGSAGTLTAGIFAFVSSVTVLMWPEKWDQIQSIIPLTFDWNMIARFKLFLFASLAFTGASILFYFFRWDGGKEEEMGTDYRGLVRNVGGGTTLAFSILSALMFLWFMVTLPYPAKSKLVYLLGVVVLFFLMLAVLRSYGILSSKTTAPATSVFVFLLGFFLMTFVTESAARGNSLLYQNYKLDQIAEKVAFDIEIARSEKSRGVEASIELGEEIYAAKCAACHRFDVKLVGPPHIDVVPKYNGDVEALKEYIYNPIKVDANYPAMPSQGLKPFEAESAAMYLLKRMEEFQQQ
ncbi:MAG: c-type cytochrome [Calditrichia bacterium]